MKRVNVTVSLMLLIISVFLSQRIVVNSLENQRNKNAYAELNSIKYGLFSTEVWKEQLVKIFASEFDRFYVSKETEQSLREHIAVILDKMIEQASAKIEKANKKTTTGKLKQVFIDIFVDIEDVKKGIPEYTDAVINEMKKRRTETEIKAIVNGRIAEFADTTNDSQDRSELLHILSATESSDIGTAQRKIDATIAAKHKLIVRNSILLVTLTLGMFWLFMRNSKPRSLFQYLILVFALMLLLVSGVATPMIDMEAKISALNFTLIGHNIQFKNQILYFQSKSIIDVFKIMITNSHIEMKLVGILVIAFSVFFPLLKLLCSVLYFSSVGGTDKNPIIKFFVFKSGKWSMADVLVVAIFMAYIGFNGIINSQLESLHSQGSGTDIISTNGTALQPGFYLFLIYVLLANVFSSFLTRNIPAVDNV